MESVSAQKAGELDFVSMLIVVLFWPTEKPTVVHETRVAFSFARSSISITILLLSCLVQKVIHVWPTITIDLLHAKWSDRPRDAA
jgi:hypothetical protein